MDYSKEIEDKRTAEVEEGIKLHNMELLSIISSYDVMAEAEKNKINLHKFINGVVDRIIKIGVIKWTILKK